MKPDQIHLLLVVAVISSVACWFGFKAGTYHGQNKELVKIVRSIENGTATK